MTGTLRIHALVIIARVLVRIGAAAEDVSAMCKRRASRILDEAVAWCDAWHAAYRRARRNERRIGCDGLDLASYRVSCQTRRSLRFLPARGRCVRHYVKILITILSAHVWARDTARQAGAGDNDEWDRQPQQCVRQTADEAQTCRIE
jgi:hypothetical protein